MKTIKQIYIILLLMLCLVFSHNSALAATGSGDLLKQPAVEVSVSLGNAANELKFEPNSLEFVAGKRYNLRLANPSQMKHYFTAKDFADGIWTQKVEAGKVEIKGAIHEVELKPGATADWVFVPLKSGKYTLRCSVAGHTEAGMTGEITVTN
ncbi:cupredoxin domain-containing protein [Calothrix sp. FACHB-1219]|uniref:cupredoxin domain-containing protein n=2 Tax=unclassified Calothrix TaxID=2619626 RepID=UPI001682421E|nr:MULTISPECIES: cupredoxin domain-containing protein [unclassified Calothrix]MBD2204397.1 cupredoxin domain-containing protein [Calothrix sp. FACHB-168]MBD2216724.1 cupredoxin domain-containing protein [Calothrix sp. FACHB-1219]